MRFGMRSGSLAPPAGGWSRSIGVKGRRDGGRREEGGGKLTRPTEPAAPEIKTVSPSFNLPTSNIPYLSAELTPNLCCSRERTK